MSGIFYYVPNVPEGEVTLQFTEGLGLGYASDGQGPTVVRFSPGPDGGHGTAFTFGDGGFGGVNHAKWEPLPGDKAWVGINERYKPGPKELARKIQRNGHLVRLSDGRDWLVPIARSVDGSSPLPQRLTWDGQKFKAGGVVEKYHAFYDAALRVWKALANTEGAEVPIEDGWGFAAMALGVNYRLGPVEAAVLDLFDTDTALRTVQAAIDWPSLQAFMREREAQGLDEIKAAPAGSDTPTA